MDNFRAEFSQALQELYENQEFIYTVWEGGSAATGYLDEYSDLDLGIICADDKVEEVFELTQNWLSLHYPERHRFRLPEPTWTGHSQCYYLLSNTPPLFYLDILVEKLSAGNRFLESDRHGNAVVWFDKKGLIDSTPTPEADIVQQGQAAYKRVLATTPILLVEVEKQLRRNNPLDAIDGYLKLIPRLAVLLNLKYRHSQYDFGIRYAYRAYPAEVNHWLQDLLFVKDQADLEQKFLILKDKIDYYLAELHGKWS